MSKHLSTPKIVERRSSAFTLFWVLLAIIGMAVWAWLGYDYGLKQGYGPEGIEAISELKAEKKVLEEKLAATETERDQQSQELAKYERSKQVDDEAAKALKDEMGRYQTQISQMKEDLAFYRSIVTPENADLPLAIQNFKVAGDGQEVEYEIVLTRGMKNDKTINGKVTFQVHGIKDGKEALTLNIADISTANTKDHAFRFRYFQSLKGSVNIPEWFEPRGVTVTAVAKKGGKGNSVSRDFQWPQQKPIEG